MRVQAFHADPSASYARAWAVPLVVIRDQRVSFGPIGLVGADQLQGIHCCLSYPDGTRGLEPTHNQSVMGRHEPVQRWHWSTGLQNRRVAKYPRGAIVVAQRNFEKSKRLSTK